MSEHADGPWEEFPIPWESLSLSHGDLEAIQEYMTRKIAAEVRRRTESLEGQLRERGRQASTSTAMVAALVRKLGDHSLPPVEAWHVTVTEVELEAASGGNLSIWTDPMELGVRLRYRDTDPARLESRQ